MAYTAVTVTGTATFPNGGAISGALVTFTPDENVRNGGTALGAAQAVAGTDGTFSIVVNATDDAGTSPANGQYNVNITDPVSGENVFAQRLAVPHAVTPVTLAALVLGNPATSV